MNKNAELPFVIAAKELGVVMEIPQSGHSNNGLVSSVWTDLIVRTLWVCSEWLCMNEYSHLHRCKNIFLRGQPENVPTIIEKHVSFYQLLSPLAPPIFWLPPIFLTRYASGHLDDMDGSVGTDLKSFDFKS